MLLFAKNVWGCQVLVRHKLPDDDISWFGACDDCASIILDARLWGGLLIFRDDPIRIIYCRSNHSACGRMCLDQCRNGLVSWICSASLTMTPCELVCQTGVLISILLQFLSIWNRNLPIPVSTTDHDFPSIQNKHWLVQRGQGEIILQQHRTESVLIELLFLFPTSERSEWVQIICLVDPHIKPHFAVYSSCSDQSLINELGFDNGFSLDEWQSALLNLAQNCRFVVFLLVLLLVHRPVDFQVRKLVGYKIVFENLFFVFFGWMLFHFELDHICRSLSVVVHLQLIWLCQIRITLTNLFQIDTVLIGDTWIRIEASLSVRTELLVAENVINPSAYVLTDIIAFQGFAKSHDELIWVLLTPRRQWDVINHLLILSLAKVDLVQVQIELRLVKEFRQDLSHVRVVTQSIQIWVL